MKPGIFKTRIGISTGDAVQTSYGSSGVIVDILGPFQGNIHGPVFTVVYVKPEHAQNFQGSDLYWINDIYRDDAGVYHCGPGDTLTIAANPEAPAQVMSLFDLPEEAGA